MAGAKARKSHGSQRSSAPMGALQGTRSLILCRLGTGEKQESSNSSTFIALIYINSYFKLTKT